MPKKITLLDYHGVSINCTVWEAKTNTKPILYLHGGGLVFGERDDLPFPFIEKFVAAGHTFISIDYLLAPESKLDQILTTLKSAIQQLHHDYCLEHLTLLGRSAGAYLCYLLLKGGLQASAFVCLYGYHTITLPEFKQPAPFYCQFPKVLPKYIQPLVKDQPLVKGEMTRRYPIYISGRQFGTWLAQFLPGEVQTKQYSVTNEELKKFPKTLLVHCIDDPDIPFRVAQEISQMIPKATLIALNKKAHYFDREFNQESAAIYNKIIQFIQ